MEEKKREEIALKRYQLISPFLLMEHKDWGQKQEILERIAAETSFTRERASRG